MTFALDNPSTGYSSLTYPKRLPVDLFNIDQCLVIDMLGDWDSLAILQAAVGLTKAFHHDIFAEGVETGTILIQMGCDLARGYGIARAMPAGKLPAWVASWQPDAACSSLPDSAA